MGICDAGARRGGRAGLTGLGLVGADGSEGGEESAGFGDVCEFGVVAEFGVAGPEGVDFGVCVGGIDAAVAPFQDFEDGAVRGAHGEGWAIRCEAEAAEVGDVGGGEFGEGFGAARFRAVGGDDHVWHGGLRVVAWLSDVSVLAYLLWRSPDADFNNKAGQIGRDP